ncbi:uncharacterized protein LOC135197427 [Macrobrachium nipponense]|uniref:uncharacterized protein LOC135197427 n=1 Tax=Macrobrachium nipponense TaxID=159736 RepID=UPI0030C8841B
MIREDILKAGRGANGMHAKRYEGHQLFTTSGHLKRTWNNSRERFAGTIYVQESEEVEYKSDYTNLILYRQYPLYLRRGRDLTNIRKRRLCFDADIITQRERCAQQYRKTLHLNPKLHTNPTIYRIVWMLDRKVDFTCAGFVSLGRSHVATTVSLIISYVVIALQFQGGNVLEEGSRRL